VATKENAKNTGPNTGSVYLRPGGFLGGVAALQAIDQGRAGLIAGGWAAYSLIELIQRQGKAIERSWHTYDEIAASNDKTLQQHLKAIEQPRKSIASLSLNKPHIMGIVNVTPDSFSDGGNYLQAEIAIAHGKQLYSDGASILDIGGESTRPGADVVSQAEEENRIVPVIKGLRDLPVPLSIDTRKPSVMTRAASAGATFINDVTALSFSPDSLKTVTELGLPVCLMHSQGNPKTMQDNPQYDDVVLDIYDYLAGRIALCLKAGISRDQIVVDPGIGFGKTVRHNLALIDEIAMFHGLGMPLLLGASRKSFISAIFDGPDAKKRLPGSLAAALCGLKAGVQFLRVHDVAETAQALHVWKATENSPHY